MKNKRNIFLMVIVLSIITLTACTKDNKKNQNSANKTEQNWQVKDSMNKVENTDKTASVNDMKANKNIHEANTTNTMTKIEIGREAFLGRLDNIQKEIDALPEKKDSDAGVTNAMRSYYGKSYDMYDRELNEIYALLKKQLSPETMKNLQTEQIKWIEHKEAEANKEASQYKGGTFEFVAYNSSLYNSTKKRCYELVNKYMTD
ncbi:DUF1311 domain-containing protein [Clostridium tyrobutyricum]|uniref:Lysozyme inhibitor LprI-like N-terminal domain-containing protein n=1 Tax=Clostridium tyrobutyricum DIVETGP TaxID=1408889 RepID=W6N793_CLOTY|nr:lysozyme inhibitor LprI family protein [Clostridium tyrobutyricum]AND83883.1 hypothetical protein CTK_C06200 [Clostridium tyrobutyricum]ANP68629.1 hypothetical protein BA182_02755 [Clostridium tyrobutyricum]MBR9648554.1 DUF1311 domain-containing protein [Clostridium tyrobutyricum]MBV4431932.1 DUF1311 domain-containing protein [Clostridium tyrobutyricum]MBV4433942.1 DUF1311 domain-containing protein [Clostridium tyrobutyricum]